MIHIKAELWPFGDKTKAKDLGEMFIANDATGTKTTGNYKAVIFNGKKRKFRTAEVKGFPRLRLNVYDLMYRALKIAVGDRNEPKVKGKKSKTIKAIEPYYPKQLSGETDRMEITTS